MYTAMIEERKNVLKIAGELLITGAAGILVNKMLDMDDRLKFIIPTLFVLGYLISLLIVLYRLTSEIKQAEAAIALDSVEANRQAEEKYKQAEALEKDAIAYLQKAVAKDDTIERLSKELRSVKASYQSLIDWKASAEQSLKNSEQSQATAIESLKQSHSKKLSTLSQERDKAVKALDKALSELSQIKEADRVAHVEKVITNTYNSVSKDDFRMVDAMEKRSKKEDEPLYKDWKNILKRIEVRKRK